MADALVGQSITETITLLDFESPRMPILGASFAVDTARDPSGNPFTPVFAEVGGGAYTVTVGPFTAAGDWYVLFHSTDATDQSFEGEWQVVVRTSGGPGAPTRATIRQRIAQELDDYRALTATGGSETTFTDPLELLDFDDLYIGAQLLVTSGDPANVGKIVRVTASTMSAATITFTPLPAAIQPGDTADLYNLRGRGVRIQDYNLAIAGAISEIRRSVCLQVQATPATYAYDTQVIAVPDEWIAVCDVHTDVDDAGGDAFFAVPPARYEGQSGWYLRKQDRTVLIAGRYQEILDGRSVTLTGYLPHPAVLSDSDPIYVDAEWLTNAVKYKLMARRRDRDSQQWAIEWGKRADGRRPLLITRWHPNTRFLDTF